MVERFKSILLPQLNHGKRPLSRPWIDEANRFERSKGESIFPASSQLLNGKASLKKIVPLEIPEGNLLRSIQSIHKPIVGLFIHREIDVVLPPFLVTGGFEGFFKIDRIGCDDRGK